MIFCFFISSSRFFRTAISASSWSRVQSAFSAISLYIRDLPVKAARSRIGSYYEYIIDLEVPGRLVDTGNFNDLLGAADPSVPR